MRRWLEALASKSMSLKYEPASEPLEAFGCTIPGVENTITEVGHTRESAGHTITGGGDTITGVGHTTTGGGGGHTVGEESAMAGAVDRVREKMLSWQDLKVMAVSFEIYLT